MSSWNAFNDWNARSRLHTYTWAEGMINYSLRSGLVDADSSILDFGCGTFEVGMGLAGHCQRIDGFDPHPASAATARRRSTLLQNVTIYDRVSDLPRIYDVVIVNSVIQYFDSADEFDRFLIRSASLLKPNGKRSVLIADIIPERYSPYRDALDAVRAAARHGFLIEMFGYLAKSALNRNITRFTRYERDALAKRAAAHGFRPQFLTENLTPFQGRYTTLLRLEA